MHRNIRTIGTLALSLALGLVLVACGGEDKPAKKKATKPAASGSSKPEAPSVDMTKLGSVKGKVVFKGAAPAMAQLDTSKDSWCAEHSEVMDETFVVDANGGLRDVVCYIEGLDAVADKFPAPKGPARLVQENCHYVPHVLVLRAEQELQVVNADETSHNYHFVGRANDEINRTQPKPATDTVLFESAELNAKFSCDIHPWMNCHVHIFDHPCFAVSAADGSFSITGIPAGSWKLRLMHADAKTTKGTIDVTVTANGTVDVGTVEFTK